MQITKAKPQSVRHPADAAARMLYGSSMNTSARMIFLSGALALTLASACAAAFGADVYQTHADIYRSLSQGDEAFNARPAPAIRRAIDEKKGVHRGRVAKDRLKIASRA